MKYTVHVGDKPIVLEHPNLDDLIDVDSLTQIDVGNVYGEAVTASASANRIGMLKAEMEKRLSDSKLELRLYEAKFKAKLRKDASENAGHYTVKVDGEDVKVKLTEKALESAFETEEEWQKIKQNVINDEKNVSILGSLHWSIQDKCRKLNNIVTNVTPEEFVEGMIEGKVNGILINK